MQPIGQQNNFPIVPQTEQEALEILNIQSLALEQPPPPTSLAAMAAASVSALDASSPLPLPPSLPLTLSPLSQALAQDPDSKETRRLIGKRKTDREVLLAIQEVMTHNIFSITDPKWFSLINLLQHYLPHLKEYILIEKERNADEGAILTPKAIRYLVELWKSEGKIEGECLVLDELIELKEVTNALLNSHVDKSSSVIVRCRGGGSQENHVSPLYFQKKGKDLTIFSTDSLGKGSWDKIIHDYLTSYFSLYQGADTQRVFYYRSPIQRQRDATNCSIFCLNDLSKLSSSEETRRFIITNNPLDAPMIHPHLHVQEAPLNKMPPSFLHMAQVKTKLDQYLSNVSDEERRFISEALTQYQGSVTIKDQSKKGNRMALDMYLNFERLLLLLVIRQSIESPPRRAPRPKKGLASIAEE